MDHNWSTFKLRRILSLLIIIKVKIQTSSVYNIYFKDKRIFFDFMNVENSSFFLVGKLFVSIISENFGHKIHENQYFPGRSLEPCYLCKYPTTLTGTQSLNICRKKITHCCKTILKIVVASLRISKTKFVPFGTKS